MRQFQDAGHLIILIIGDTTAAIGDPTGRNAARPPLDDADIAVNGLTYLQQVSKILDMSENRFVHRYNSDWLKDKPLDEVIELAANFSVQQLLHRDDFRNRMERNQPIRMHELLYPMLQAYDSFWVEADIELGGTDQLFNLMMGRDYMRIRGGKAQVIATVPLLEGLSGGQKMSKSLNNHIGLTEDPFSMFSKVLSISDDLMVRWGQTLFQMPENDLPPMEAKLRLAWWIVELLHGSDEASLAQTEWRRVFSGKEKPTDIIHMVLPDLAGFLRLDKLVFMAGLAPSITEARRLIKAGAVEVNGSKRTNEGKCDFTEAEIRVGRKWMKITSL